MTRVRIVCLAPARNWVRIKENNDVMQNLLKMNQNSKSWVNTSVVKGRRYGLYKQPFVLEDKKFVMLPLVWEKISNAYNTNLENLLDPKPESKTISEPQPIIIQSEIIFDVEEGIC